MEIPLSVSNTGNGILLWDVVEHPEWITVNSNTTAGFSYDHILAPNSKNTSIYLSLDIEKINFNSLSERLLIASNDKKRPVTEVSIDLDLGNPSLRCNINTIDLNNNEDYNNFYFYNTGDGVLLWRIEDCPEWLTLSATSGYMTYYSQDIRFSFAKNDLPTDIN